MTRDSRAGARWPASRGQRVARAMPLTGLSRHLSGGIGGVEGEGVSSMVSPRPVKNGPELDPPVLNVVGERVVLGPLRRDLLPAYQRWANDLSAADRLGLLPQPVTLERQT